MRKLKYPHGNPKKTKKRTPPPWGMLKELIGVKDDKHNELKPLRS